MSRNKILQVSPVSPDAPFRSPPQIGAGEGQELGAGGDLDQELGAGEGLDQELGAGEGLDQELGEGLDQELGAGEGLDQELGASKGLDQELGAGEGLDRAELDPRSRAYIKRATARLEAQIRAGLPLSLDDK